MILQQKICLVKLNQKKISKIVVKRLYYPIREIAGQYLETAL